MAKETEVGPRGKEAPKEVSRREFVKGAAVGAAAVAGAGALASCAAPTPEVIKETVEVPVEVTRIVEKEVPCPPGEAGPVTLEVLDPTGGIEVTQLHAARLDTLEGKTIGISAGPWEAATTMPLIEELLKKQFPTVKFVDIDISGTTTTEKQVTALIEETGIQAAIIGNAGWGSCSTERGRAAALLEKQGITTMVVTRQGFSQVVGNAMAGFGFPPEGPTIFEFPVDMFMPGADLTPLREGIDHVVYGLTKWEPKVTEKGILYPATKVTAQGKDGVEAVSNMNLVFLKNMWSTGLPIQPATEERVNWILTGTDLPRDTVIGKIVPRGGIATPESLAILLAMAGGRPEYMPVLIAAVKALLDPGMILQTWSTTTCSTYPVVIVNGPVAKQIRLSSGYGCLGPDPVHSAGANIGHAIRLMLQDLGGTIAGIGTMAIYGGANRYTNLVFAEDEANSPWAPLSVDRGFSPGENAVTVYSVSTTVNVCCVNYGTAEQGQVALDTFNQVINFSGQYGGPGDGTTYDKGAPGVLLMAYPLARCIADNNGWSKEKVKTYLWEHSTMNPGGYYKTGFKFGGTTEVIEDIPITAKPENFIIVVCGGAQSMHGYWMGAGCCGLVPASQGITLPANWDELLAQAAEDLGPLPAM